MLQIFEVKELIPYNYYCHFMAFMLSHIHTLD